MENAHIVVWGRQASVAHAAADGLAYFLRGRASVNTVDAEEHVAPALGAPGLLSGRSLSRLLHIEEDAARLDQFGLLCQLSRWRESAEWQGRYALLVPAALRDAAREWSIFNVYREFHRLVAFPPDLRDLAAWLAEDVRLFQDGWHRAYLVPGVLRDLRRLASQGETGYAGSPPEVLRDLKNLQGLAGHSAEAKAFDAALRSFEAAPGCGTAEAVVGTVERLVQIWR